MSKNAGCSYVLLFASGLFLLLTSVTAKAFVAAGPSNPPEEQLKFVVILIRHGTRSPIHHLEDLNAYSGEPWPAWEVPPGNLTPHGRKSIVLLGSYYRSYLVDKGLLPSGGCEGANQVEIHSDLDKRDQDTAEALVSGMMPDCRVAVHVVPGNKDPLFSPVASGIGRPNGALAAASISGRVGADPQALVTANRPAFYTLREVLFDCAPRQRCLAEMQPGKRAVLQQRSSVQVTKSGHGADVEGPLKIGSSLGETLLLEYANGMAGNKLGWGRLTRDKLLEITRIRSAYVNLTRESPYIARVQASNLLSHILCSLEQAVRGSRVEGSLGQAGNHMVIVVGHDTNISNIAGMLGLSWVLEGYQPNETPPGGALVWELWKRADGSSAVATYFVAQSLDQLRENTSLQPESPPLKAPIFISGCSGEDQRMTCPWSDFYYTLKHAIDPAFVKP